MANYKVPSQAASGAETFSDFLVGLQFTDGSSQMTNGTFVIDNSIPERDTKEFITQPFSQFVTLDDINQEVNTQNELYNGGTTNNPEIKFNNDKTNADRSYFGSLKQRIGVAVNDIITKYPAAVMVDTSSPIGINNNSAESIVYDPSTFTTQFEVQYGLIYNPLEVKMVEPATSVLVTDNDLRNFYSSYTKYVIDLSGTTYNILTYSEPNSENKITLNVEGNPFNGVTAYTMNYLIRPNNGVVEEFYKGLDDVQRVLINRETNPKFNAGFDVPRDTNGGYNRETITVYANWPISRDTWNIQIVGLDYDYYIEKISSFADEIDAYRTNLIVRFLTSPQLYEFDTEEKKIEAIFQIYGQSFDQVKTFIDNIAYMRNVSYDGINNVPDMLLKNLSETLGLSTVSLFDEKSLQDSLYTRHDVRYDGISLGSNLIEAETEFYRRILVNLAYLYKSKGTRNAIEFFLKFIGAPEPIIRLDEYVYRVDNGLPSNTVEDDIQDAIQGTRVVNIVEYTVTTGFTGYTLTQLSGSTTLTRDEYPVDEDTGLPRGIEYSDGSMFFEKGAGWYKKTLDHRSPDILDTANSNLTGRTKTIKTMSKPFTYGEDYFNVYRSLPGLDYGYELIADIDNRKIEIVTDETTSRLTLNRKNINVFLSADRAIDYDIYRKSRDLGLSFSNLTPQTGKTFAEYLDDVISEVISNSNVVRYKNIYTDLLQVYKSYLISSGFTPYNYIAVNDFINRLSPYWVNIIEQFIPATTLWTGGNVIENGTFNRSKLKYKQPALPMAYTEVLYPDFETVLYEDLETIVGGGTMDDIDYSLANFRGLQLFSGVTFEIVLNINDQIYSGTTAFFKPFSGYSYDNLNVECTVIPESTQYAPLFCGEFELFNGGDSIDTIKAAWKTTLNNLVTTINTANQGCYPCDVSNGEYNTGFTLSVEYYTDIDGIDKAKFIITPHDYYGRTGNEVFGYYFRPLYTTEKQTCSLSITPGVNGGDFTITVSGAQGYHPADIIEIFSGVTCSDMHSVDIPRDQACRFHIPLTYLSPTFMMMFNDGGNCERRMSFVGTTGSYLQTYNYGLKQGSVVYKINLPLPIPVSGMTYQDVQNCINGGCIEEVNVEDVMIGDVLLSLELKSCEEWTARQFTAIPTNYQFAFNYTSITIDAIECLSSNKTNIINDTFEVLPTGKILVYSDINEGLEDVPYNFVWKYPEDIYPRPSDDSRNGDFIIDHYGFPSEVTGVTLDYCRTDVYYELISVPLVSGNTIILFNGKAGIDDSLVVQYLDELVIPSPSASPAPSSSTTPTPTPSITPSVSTSMPPTQTPTATPTPSPSYSIGASPPPSESPSVTPSVPPSETPSTTPTPTPSATTPAAEIYIASTGGTGNMGEGTLGVNNGAGKTFTISGTYYLYASCDNGGYPCDTVDATTTFEYSTDGGTNWTGVDSAAAFFDPPPECESGGDQATVVGVFSIAGITNVGNVILRVINSCNSGSLPEYGEGTIRLTGVTVDSGSATIICDDTLQVNCYSGVYKECGGTPPSPSVTPSASAPPATPSVTPSITSSAPTGISVTVQNAGGGSGVNNVEINSVSVTGIVWPVYNGNTEIGSSTQSGLAYDVRVVLTSTSSAESITVNGDCYNTNNDSEHTFTNVDTTSGVTVYYSGGGCV